MHVVSVLLCGGWELRKRKNDQWMGVEEEKGRPMEAYGPDPLELNLREAYLSTWPLCPNASQEERLFISLLLVMEPWACMSALP